eukprot:GEMP01095985.1.p2 GENE.GEMP01095985.1~~GEMP01095985.1.p2  ORF type:complete len:110 (+),score=4.95 GEMP01095985.1:60-389(+)
MKIDSFFVQYKPLWMKERQWLRFIEPIFCFSSYIYFMEQVVTAVAFAFSKPQATGLFLFGASFLAIGLKILTEDLQLGVVFCVVGASTLMLWFIGIRYAWQRLHGQYTN